MPRQSETIKPGMAIPGPIGITRGFANKVVEVTDSTGLFRDLYLHVSDKVLQLAVDGNRTISIVCDNGVIARIPTNLQDLQPQTYEVELYD